MKNGWLARRDSALRLTFPLVLALILLAGCTKAPQATSGPAPLATPAEPKLQQRTQRDFERDHYAWLVRQTVQAAQKAAISQQATVDPNILDFLNHACLYQLHQDKAPTLASLEDEARRLLDASYDQPIFLRAAGQVLADARKTSEAASLELQAIKVFEGKPSAKVNLFLAADQLAAALRDLQGSRAPEAARWQQTALDALIEAIAAGSFTQDEAPIAYRLLASAIARAGDDSAWSRALDALGGTNLGPWLQRMVAGHADLEAAAKARGNEPAGKVSEQTWVAFYEQLAEARKDFSGAWRARPGRPEAPTAMIRVAMQEKNAPAGETDRTWFDRAAAAQVDYLPAFDAMADKLAPAGTDALDRFGRDCLATGRFDTAAPLYYWAVLRRIAEAKPGDAWRVVFRRPGVRERLMDLYQKLLQQPAWAAERGKILALKIVTEAWSGNYDESRRLLDQFGPQADLDGEILGRPILWRGQTRPVFLAELEAFTGPQKSALRKAEDLLLGAKPSDVALQSMTQAMDASRDNRRVFIYLRDRIAVSRLQLPADEYLDYRHGMTALYLATRHGALDVMRFLLERGADPAARYDKTATPLDIARETKNARAASLLQEMRPLAALTAPPAAQPAPAPASAATSTTQPAAAAPAPVANAAATSATQPAAATEELGAPRDGAALMQAITKGDAAAAGTLISGGADIKARDEAGMTPLHIATQKRQAATIRTLLENGAAVNAKTNSGHTPLHLACENGAIESVRILLDGGANVNEAAPDGWTPLSLAVQRNYPNIVKLLLEGGAKVNAPGIGGARPLDIAVAAGETEIVKQLLDLGADVNTSAGGNPKPLEQAIQKNHAEIAVMLIDLGANVNAADPKGQMPLHNAVERREGLIVAKLLGTGAQPGAVNKENKTALQVAIEKGFDDMVETLLNKGASVRTPASDGRSMLELAQASGNQKIIDLVTAKAAKQRSGKPSAPAPGTPANPPASASPSTPTAPSAPGDSGTSTAPSTLPAANPAPPTTDNSASPAAPAPTATPTPPAKNDTPEVPAVPGV